MADDDKETSLDKHHPVRWKRDEWNRISEAATILRDREHIEITPTDIIRSGAIRRADEIIEAARVA